MSMRSSRNIIILGVSYQYSYVISLLFLIPYFFLRVAYGSENAHIDLSLGWLQMLIGIYVFLHNWNRADSQASLLGHYIVFSLVAIHFLSIVVFVDLGITTVESLFFVFVPVYLYLFISLLSANYFISVSPKIIEQVFLKLSLFSIAISIATFILSSIGGVSVLVNHYGGTDWVRAHAFMTEPSGMAAPIAYVIAFSIINSNYRVLILGFSGLIVTQSAVVALISILLLIVALYIKSHHKSYFITAGIVLVVTFSSWFLTYDCMAENDVSPVVYKSVCGVQAIWNLDNQVLINANPRLATTLMAIDLLNTSNGWFTGFGLNSSAVLMRIHFDDVENSLFVSMMLFFGIWGVLIYFLIVYWGYRRARLHDASFVVFYLSLLASVTLNSAGGFYGYLIFFFVFYVLIINNVSRNRNRNRNCDLIKLKY
jgi:hypothetical protein